MAITNFISTVWSENLYRELDKQYIAVSHCNRDYEGEIKGKGSTVKICGIGNITVGDYTKNTNMSNPQTLSDNVRELTINQAKYFNFQIDDIDRAQSSPKLMGCAVKKAAEALASYADSYVFSLYSQAGNRLNFSLDDTSVLNDILAARTAMFKGCNAETDDIILEVSPEVGEAIMKEKANLQTDNSETLEAGCIGTLYGMKVFVSPNIFEEEVAADVATTAIYHKCLMRTRRSIAFAEQLSEIEAYRPELRFADAVKGLHLYGAKVVYPSEMITLNFYIRDKENG